jgi:anti-sigma-K factor RskA
MSISNPLNEEDKILAAEYVAGLLNPAERTAFERRMAAEVPLREEVRFWDERLIPMTDAIAPVQVPASVYAGIESRLFTDEKHSINWLQSLFFWRSLSFASLAALAIAGVLYVQSPPIGGGPSENFIAEVAGADQSVKVAMLYDGQKGEIKFTRVSGAPVSGRDFQLWLIQGKNAPISLGVLPAQDKGIIKLSDDLKAKLSGSILAISDEPAGGSPTGQPTGAVLATGAMTLI